VSDRAAVIVQARMGSRRLPGKSLVDVAGRSLLGQCIWRLRASAVPIVVATTHASEDDAIEHEATRLGALVYRGSVHDVLGRFIDAARAAKVTRVVRATADNPAVDFSSVGRSLDILDRTHADHVIEAGLPYGTAVEAMSLDALERAAELTTDREDREHVTPFIRRDARFTAIRAIAPPSHRRSAVRLTVDTADDLDFLRAVLTPFSGAVTPPPFVDVLRVADRLWPAHRAGLALREAGA
jgi:spore coat polysaccharide biosynthesis protein SpsF